MSPLQGHRLSELLQTQSEPDRATFFHVGLLVPDLDETVRNYGRLLGLSFTGPVTVSVPRLEEPRRRPISIDVRVACSQQGPPYYELLEKTGDGFYGARPDGLNHVAIWVQDVEEAAQELEELGLQREATQYDDDGTVLNAFLQPSDLLAGLRLELVPEWRREPFEEWIMGVRDEL